MAKSDTKTAENEGKDIFDICKDVVMKLCQEKKTIDDYIKILPKVMELAELHSKGFSGEDKKQLVLGLLTYVVKENSNNIDKDVMVFIKTIAPSMIDTIISASLQEFNLNPQLLEFTHKCCFGIRRKSPLEKRIKNKSLNMKRNKKNKLSYSEIEL